ncbi:riboflavin transporter [Oceanobacillus oncorhynchi subsp. incaldanensis]|uniref:Riboflavin transporter n=2 Tax=Oceanobacillus TaxID=182709 RepID=A0A0A1MNZ2_9BACI|nr:ECF transporter S component [Oceanobacillus oncorhynchi]MDM8098491.1 ECF transporter S component [Oceanobacillus oncorhynchi]UUI38952.1 ECF transporter S component [Oceanobacillus oncorhynchi]GIO21168.1 riboflavin transporter [Oceanobacillus oncorhynchi subsp. incaldanensis]CEI81509.1 Riboflavin transporter FmnP [Oceanobacillus oncorhynchi]
MQKKKKNQLLKLIIIALLSTISLVLFFINFPLPFLPTPYLKVDFSDVPALIASLIFSPLAGVLVVGFKNLLYLAVSGSGEPIGVLSNFVAGVMIVLPVSLIYHRVKGLKGLITGLAAGTVIMAVGMSVLNYYFILPAYGWFMGWEMSEQVKWVTVIGGVLPFNFIKGIIIAILFIPLFNRMQSWIQQQRTRFI